MLSLNVLEESNHIRSSKVINCLESSEHTSIGDSLEMILTNVQHCGSKIKFVEKFGNKYVNFEDICHIFPLNISEDIDKPFKVSMGLTNPKEIDFLTRNTRITIS